MVLRDVFAANGERVFLDVTSSDWYRGAAETVWTDYAAPLHGVSKDEFTLFAISLESGAHMFVPLVQS